MEKKPFMKFTFMKFLVKLFLETPNFSYTLISHLMLGLQLAFAGIGDDPKMWTVLT